MNIESIPTNLYTEAAGLFKPNKSIIHMYDMLYDLFFFPEQLKDALEYSKEKITTDSLNNLKEKNIGNIICAGMGGSNVSDFLYAFDAKVPIIPVRGYELPYFVNEKTLVFITSHSGTTEEMISCLGDAIFKDANIFVISGIGRDLLKCVGYYNHLFKHKEKKISYLPIRTGSTLPRTSLGRLLVPMLYVLDKLNLLSYDNETKKLIASIDNIAEIEKKHCEEIADVIRKCNAANERFKEFAGEEAEKLLSVKELVDFVLRLEEIKKETTESYKKHKPYAGYSELGFKIFRASNFLAYERENIIKTAQSIANISYMTNSSLCIHLLDEHYKGLVARIKNQFSENAKMAVDVRFIPEECHNAVESLNNSFNIFIKDNLVLQRNIQRGNIIKNIIEKENQQSLTLQTLILYKDDKPKELEILLDTIRRGYMEIELHGHECLEKLLEIDYIFAWASLYLGLLNGSDPSGVPIIKSIKDKLDNEVLEKFYKRIFYLLLPKGCIPRS